jgi:hypothetical protein
MEIKEKVKNEQIKQADEKLADLPVIEEQAEETKGAGAPQGRLYLGTDAGVFVG